MEKLYCVACKEEVEEVACEISGTARVNPHNEKVLDHYWDYNECVTACCGDNYVTKEELKDYE